MLKYLCNCNCKRSYVGPFYSRFKKGKKNKLWHLCFSRTEIQEFEQSGNFFLSMMQSQYLAKGFNKLFLPEFLLKYQKKTCEVVHFSVTWKLESRSLTKCKRRYILQLYNPTLEQKTENSQKKNSFTVGASNLTKARNLENLLKMKIKTFNFFRIDLLLRG